METILEDVEESIESLIIEESPVRWMTDVYLSVQKIRIGVGNRIWAREAERDMTDSVFTDFQRTLYDKLYESEQEIANHMKYCLDGHPAWDWLKTVKGVGPTLATQLIGLIGDIEKAPSVSALWRFAGLAVIDGKAETLVKGEKSHYNKRLKTCMFKVASSFLKSNSPYRRFYDESKAYYEKNRPDWTPLRIHRAAMRKMNKIFLQHLWVTWREAEGLPVSQPWVIEHGGHVDYIGPDDV